MKAGQRNSQSCAVWLAPPPDPVSIGWQLNPPVLHSSLLTPAPRPLQMYVSGQIGVVPGSKPPAFASEGVAGQAEQVRETSGAT